MNLQIRYSSRLCDFFLLSSIYLKWFFRWFCIQIYGFKDGDIPINYKMSNVVMSMKVKRSTGNKLPGL